MIDPQANFHQSPKSLSNCPVVRVTQLLTKATTAGRGGPMAPPQSNARPDDQKVPHALTEAPHGASQVKRHAMWLIPVILAVVVLVVVGVIFFSSDSSVASPAATGVSAACLQRVVGELRRQPLEEFASTGIRQWPLGWSSSFRNGQMTGPMMWGSASSMDSVCRLWMDSGSRASISTTTSPGWCDGMVTWMQQHNIGNWDDWTMNGNMDGT